MCSIVGSYNQLKALDLIKLNEYRGALSNSKTIFCDDFWVFTSRRQGPVEESSIIIDTGCYGLFHTQAPTTDAGTEFIHPASNGNSYLWHNGIIKQTEIERLVKHYNFEPSLKWDTEIILRLIDDHGFDVLSEIDGTFACVYLKRDIAAQSDKLYIFRNEISPFFVDDDLNISSTKFDNSRSLEPNIIWQIDLLKQEFINTGIGFKTKENPYYFGE